MSDATLTEVLQAESPVEPVAELSEAVEAAAPEAPVEEVKADPAAEKMAARFAALSRKEKELWRQQQEIKRKEQELEPVKIKWQRFEEGDPEAVRQYFEEKGIAPEEWVRRVINDGKPTPESKLEAMERKLAELEAERTAKAEAERAEMQRHALEQATTAFLSFVDDNAAKFPLLTEYTDREVKDFGLMVARELVESGNDDPSDEEVAIELERQLKEIHRQRAERKAKLQAKASPAAAATTPASPAKTLTNAAASEKVSNGRELTQAERDAESIRILKEYGF